MAAATEAVLFVLFDVLTGFVGAWTSLVAAAAGHLAIMAVNLFTRRRRDRREAAWQRMVFAAGMWCSAAGLSKVLIAWIDNYHLGMAYAVYVYFLPKICTVYLITVVVISAVVFIRK